MKKISAYLYFIFALLHLLGILLSEEELIMLTKPLLLLCLGGYFWLNRARQTPFLNKLILGALFFSLLGDIFLMMVAHPPKVEQLFLAGLGSFLITQALYTLSFSKIISWKNGFLRRNWYWSIPFLLYFLGFNYFIWNRVDVVLRIAIMAYSAVITAMALSALNTRGGLSIKAFSSLMGGVLLFLLSDSIIGINKFATPIPHSGLWIMSTYILAQWFIIAGVLKHTNRA